MVPNDPNLCPTCHGPICDRCGGRCGYCGASTGCHAHNVDMVRHAKSCVLTADQQAQCNRMIEDDAGRYLFDDPDYDNRLDAFDYLAAEFVVLELARRRN